MAQKIRKTISKKEKNSFTLGTVHIQSTFNNTIVTITNLNGDTISWASAGSSGFKGARKGTPSHTRGYAKKSQPPTHIENSQLTPFFLRAFIFL